MQISRSQPRTYSLPDWLIALALLVLLVLSFGLVIPWLKLYWDDWPVVAAVRLQGLEAFADFYRGERPLSGWTYQLTVPLLGTHPLVGHLFTLLLRWLTVLLVWWSLRGLWPARRVETTWMAVIFAVYPVFTQQPVAVAFSQHWICYALYAFSLGASIFALRASRWFWLLNITAWLAALLSMLTMEYFWGLELLRPVLLWLVLSNQDQHRKHRLWRVLGLWAPFLLALLGVVIWRMFYMPIVEIDPNRPDLIYSLAHNPLQTLLRLVQLGVQDGINNLLGAWYQTVTPGEIDLTDRVVLATWSVALLTAGMVFFFLKRLEDDAAVWEETAATPGWQRQALAVGLLGMLFGPLPVWITDRQALEGLYSGRFALAAMLGLSVLLVALLSWFTPRRLPKLLLLALLVGAAAGFHLRGAVAFYRSTLRQNDFYWQLAWRAPNLQPGTAILSADELFSYVGRAATGTALNLVYPQPAGTRQMGYWFFELYHNIGPKVVPKLGRGRPLENTFRTFQFNGMSTDSLVVYYKPGAGRCLWVLSPEDTDNPEIPELTRQALPAANLGRIQPGPRAAGYPPADLFGPEPAHTWCYYYQQAELAAQLEDWQAVASYGDQARQEGFAPENPFEWAPFIEGYALAGRWELAQSQTLEALTANLETSPSLCALWERIQARSDSEPGIDLGALRSQLGCVAAP